MEEVQQKYTPRPELNKFQFLISSFTQNIEPDDKSSIISNQQNIISKRAST